MQQFQWFYWVAVHIRKLVHLNKVIRISHDWSGEQRGGAWKGARPTHWGAKPSQSECVFPNKRALLQNNILLRFIICPGGWSQTLHRWRSRMCRSWAGVVTRGLRLWGRLDVLPNPLKLCWRRLMVEKSTLNYLATALLDSQHANCTLPQNICGYQESR